MFLSGCIAQLGEHLICTQGVAGSIPVASTKHVREKGQDEHSNILCIHRDGSWTSFSCIV